MSNNGEKIVSYYESIGKALNGLTSAQRVEKLVDLYRKRKIQVYICKYSLERDGEPSYNESDLEYHNAIAKLIERMLNRYNLYMFGYEYVQDDIFNEVTIWRKVKKWQKGT